MTCSEAELIKQNIQVAQTLGHIVALRDHETGGHNDRVAYISSLFGADWGLDQTTQLSLTKGAFLHDLGKVAIPDRVLLKPGSLDEKEWAIMQTHPELGVELLADLPWFHDALPVIMHHHEKFDGSGYPSGLASKNIPLNARLFAVIDVFDALISVRPYKTAFSIDKALGIIKDESGRHFDPEVIEAFTCHISDYMTNIEGHTESEIRASLEAQRRKMLGF